MALTRSHMRQLSFLLEVAPLSPPASVRTACRFGAHTRFAQCSRRRNQSSKAWRKTQERPTADSPAARQRKAQNEPFELVADLGRKTSESRRSAQEQGARYDAEAGNRATLVRLEQVLVDTQLPLRRDRAVTEQQTLESLKICFDLARLFDETAVKQEALTPVMEVLFSLPQGSSEAVKLEAVKDQALSIRKQAIDKIMETAYKLVADPKVFLSEEVLKMYVVFKSYLNRPGDLPDVFELYANKPVPEKDSSPVKLKSASPDKAASAIPLDVAQAALDSAVEVKDLNLALEIIDKSVCTKAFRNRKFISQGLVPSLGVAALPFAAFAGASQFAVFQEHMSTATAQWVGFAGITSYFVFTGTIGFVALTTANDQMRRVTWAGGLPLRERWMRESERSFLDQVACAWGLKNSHRWGEEEGPEWDALKELIGMRGMVLDKVELMEGMN